MMMHILSFVNFDSGRSSAITRTRRVGRLTPTRGKPGAAVGGLVHQELPGDAWLPRR